MANDHVTTGATQQQALFHLSHTLPNDPNGCSLIFIELEGAHESGGCAAALYGRSTRGTLGACSAGVESGNPALTNLSRTPQSQPELSPSIVSLTIASYNEYACAQLFTHFFCSAMMCFVPPMLSWPDHLSP